MSRIEGSNTLLEGEEAFTNVCVSPILEEPAPVTNGQAITISTSLYYCSKNFAIFRKFLEISKHQLACKFDSLLHQYF